MAIEKPDEFMHRREEAPAPEGPPRHVEERIKPLPDPGPWVEGVKEPLPPDPGVHVPHPIVYKGGPPIDWKAAPKGGGRGFPRTPEEVYNREPIPKWLRSPVGGFETPGDTHSEIDVNPNTNYNINRSFVFLHTRPLAANFIELHRATQFPPLTNFDRVAQYTVPVIVNVTASGGIPILGARVFLEFTTDNNARVVDDMGAAHEPTRKAFTTRDDGTTLIEYLPGTGATNPVAVEAVVKSLNDAVLVRTAKLLIEI